MNIQKLSYTLLFLVLLVHILIVGQQLLAPLAWSAFLAILILSPVQWFEKKGIPAPIAAIISILLLTTLIAGVVFFLSREVISLLQDLPKLGGRFEGTLGDVQLFLSEKIGLSKEFQTAQIAKSIEQFTENGLSGISQTLTSAAIAITYLTLMPLFIFFLIHNRKIYFQFFLQLGNDESKLQTAKVIHKARNVAQQYLYGMVLVTLIMGLLFAIVLFGLGIKHALFFAVFLAVFNLIPYVGVFLSSLVTVLYVYLTSDTLFLPLLTLGLLWGLQIFENNLITPYVVGGSVHANPLAVIIALLAGGMIWGVSGMVLFIPLIGALRAIFEEFESTKPFATLLGEPDKKT
ncbi:AI-2E family transporter [Peijinzhouia sedimentorum]